MPAASIAADRVEPGSAVVASNGSMALAVWTESRTGQSDIFAARVDAAGKLIDPYAIRITSSPLEDESPRVLWNGGEFVVLWQTVTPGGGQFDPRVISMRTVAPDGRLGATTADIARGYLEDAAISFGIITLAVRPQGALQGSVAVFLFDQGRRIAQALLTSNGTAPRLTATASGFAAMWMSPVRSQAEFHAARFSQWGAMEQADVFVGATDLYDWKQFDLTARGDDVFLALGGEDAITLLRMERLRQPQLLATLPVSGNVTDLLWSGDGFVMATRDALLLVSANGTLRAEKRLSTWVRAAVTLLGARPFAVTSSSPFVEPVNVYGEFIDAPRAILSRAAAMQSGPVIASDGERLLIAWTETTSVRGVLATRDGQPLGAAFEIFPAKQSAHGLAAIFAGGEYVVVRQEPNEPFRQLEYVVATHVARDGIPRGDRVVIANAAHPFSGIALATDGTNALVTWSGAAAPPNGHFALLTPSGRGDYTYDFLNDGTSVDWNGAIYAAIVPGTISIVRVARDGTPSPPQYLGQVFGSAPSIASDGSAFFAAWVRAGAGDGDLMGLLLDADARPRGAPFLILPKGETSPSSSDYSIEAAWNGRTFDLAWATRTGIVGRRLSRDARASSTFAIPDAGGPALLGLGDGDTIAAYARPVAELGGSVRVFTRLLAQPRGRPVRP